MGKLSLSFGNSFLENSKPYFAMISLQFGYAGMNIISKVSLSRGMSHYVLVVYRHVFATASIAPFVLFFERRGQPRITLKVFIQIFMLALFGPVIDQNFYYAGLKYTSPTFSCAMSNMLPAMTFVMAVIFRMEKLEIKKVRCQAKILGTLVTVGGAMVMTLYKGPLLVGMGWSKHNSNIEPSHSHHSSNKDWFKGSIFLIIATLAWSSLFVLQNQALKTYENHQFTLTTLVCFVGTLQAIVVTLVAEHKASVWRIGWDMNLLASAYAGIVTSSISYYVQGLVMKKRGPVFATAFSPLMMIIVAIMGSFILAERIYLGEILGSILIVFGLYSVLWGKHKENLETKIVADADQLPQIIKPSSQPNNDNNNNNSNNNNNNNNIVTLEANKLSNSLFISMCDPETPIKPNQIPRE